MLDNSSEKKAAAVEQDKLMQLFKKLEKDLETLSDKLQKESENEILKSFAIFSWCIKYTFSRVGLPAAILFGEMSRVMRISTHC
jgi:hypothetical protein